jgi:hypothetical protein
MAKKQTESKTMDNQTLEKLKRIYNQADSFGKELMEKEFPELKENEDERIKGAIIDHLKDNGLTEWASWLEKQVYKKPCVIYPKFKVGDVIKPVIPNGHYVPVRVICIVDGLYQCESDDKTEYTSFDVQFQDMYELVGQNNEEESK